MKRQLAFATTIVAAQCLCLPPAGAAVNFQTVHGLYRICSNPSHVQQSYCFGFIAGVAAAMHASTALLEARGIHAKLNWCATDSPTHEEKVQAFKNWHNRHPELARCSRIWRYRSVASDLALPCGTYRADA